MQHASHIAALLLFTCSEHACLGVMEDQFMLFEQGGENLENGQMWALYENE